MSMSCIVIKTIHDLHIVRCCLESLFVTNLVAVSLISTRHGINFLSYTPSDV
jgi:hypothetical protein